MTELIDPAEVAADMLKKQLPGFETLILSARDAIAVKGALPVWAGVSQEAVLFPVYASGAGVAALDRTAIEVLVMPGVQAIVENVQKLAIEAVNLQPQIDRLVEAARLEGSRQGFLDGLERGRSEGRRNLLRELEDARRALVNLLEEQREEGELE